MKLSVRSRHIKLNRKHTSRFAILPSVLTLGNAVCGFGSITLAVRWTGYDQATSLFSAGCLLYLAMLFDSLDGAAARWTNQTSDFGAQLDSLSDTISFGVAPAVLMLELTRSYGYEPRVLWVTAALYVICTILRLARYNAALNGVRDPGVFWGLPSPGAAAVVASYPIMLFGPQVLSGGEPATTWTEIDDWATKTMPIAMFCVSCLMVSRVRYPHVLHALLRKRRKGPYLIRLVFCVALLVAFPRIAFPLLAGWYAFMPPLRAIWYPETQRRITTPLADLSPAPDDDRRL